MAQAPAVLPRRYGMPNAYGATHGLPYSYTQTNQYAHDAFGEKTALPRRRRLNIVAASIGVFMPWLLFSLVYAMLSFSMHYRSPTGCLVIVTVIGLALGGWFVLSAAAIIRRKTTTENVSEADDPSWHIFYAVTGLFALLAAVYVGDRNFWVNLQPYYDTLALNSYVDVDPAVATGEELMDAGRVMFAAGAHPDTHRSVGFKNMDTYCAAPITGGVSGDAPLANYDFWAVGTNCCEGGSFTCSEYGILGPPRGGLRIVRDEDRSFYRLAVNQAESIYHITARHPLFFHFVDSPDGHVDAMRRNGFKYYLVGMIVHFVFQFGLVSATCYWFHKR